MKPEINAWEFVALDAETKSFYYALDGRSTGDPKARFALDDALVTQELGKLRAEKSQREYAKTVNLAAMSPAELVKEIKRRRST
jgi:hypothetical protein